MTLPNNSAPVCIQDLVQEVSARSFDFSTLQQAYAPNAEDVIFQFEAADPTSCFESVTFIKESPGERLGYIALTIAGEHRVSLSQIEEQFGQFRVLPPEGPGAFTALGRMEADREDVGFALVVESGEPIAGESQVAALTVRFDYED